MAESKEELKSLSMKVKEQSEKADLKLNIEKSKIMASDPITSWQIDGEKVESDRFYFLRQQKSPVDGDCSHEIKRHLLLGRKGRTNLVSVLKSRDITLPTKVHLSKLWFFQWSCTDMRVGIKKNELQRIVAFKLWYWRRLLRVHLTARRSNQSILKEIYSEYSLEGLMLSYNTWLPHAKSQFTGKYPDAGKD